MAETREAVARDSGIRARRQELGEQLKRLVRAEQKLYMSQRALGRQLRRVDALNRFALAAGQEREPRAILRLAFELCFELFPYEQAVALTGLDGGGLVAAAVGAVAGREQASERRLAELSAAAPMAVEVPDGPRLVSECQAAGEPLLGVVDRFFDPAPATGGAALLLPLAQRGSAPSVIVLRRLSRAKSFHEELPSEEDVPFLVLMARQIDTALSNAALVSSLRHSYVELERAQKELVLQERLAAIGELAAMVAHEVRNPLAAIMNSASVLERIVLPTADVRQMLGIMHEEAGRLERIVADLLAFARPDSPRRAVTSIAGVANEAVASTRADANDLGVAVSLEALDEGAAEVDPHMLHRALVNLVTNAVQASAPGDEVRVRVFRDEAGLAVAVSDQGSGIEVGTEARLFEPFYTTKASGTGLGLTVVKRFAEAHDGSVSVSSSERGTTFTLRIG